jgi:hypothetical protein
VIKVDVFIPAFPYTGWRRKVMVVAYVQSLLGIERYMQGDVEQMIDMRVYSSLQIAM